MSILFLIDFRFCVSFPQAFIDKFIQSYYIHKAEQQRSLAHFSWCTTIERNNPGSQRKSCRQSKNVKGHTVHLTVFCHMIPDRTKSLLTEVREGVFMNEMDSFGTSEVTRVSTEIKYGVQVKTYRCKWVIIWR